MNGQEITKEIEKHAIEIYKICEKNKVDYLNLAISNNALYFNNDYWKRRSKKIDYNKVFNSNIFKKNEKK